MGVVIILHFQFESVWLHAPELWLHLYTYCTWIVTTFICLLHLNLDYIFILIAPELWQHSYTYYTWIVTTFICILHLNFDNILIFNQAHRVAWLNRAGKLDGNSSRYQVALETEWRWFSKIILESNVTPNISRSSDSFITIPPIVNRGDWGCIVCDVESIIVLSY